MKTTIDRAGRIVIPKAIRKEAGIQPGQEINITYTDGEINIQAVSVSKHIEKRGNFWVIVPDELIEPLTPEIVNETLESIRNRHTLREEEIQ